MRAVAALGMALIAFAASPSMSAPSNLLPAIASPAPAKEQPGDPFTETVHAVMPGETLGGVAYRAKVPRTLIIEANGLKPPFTLKAGQQLVIPRRRTHTVKTGDTSFSIALQQGVAWSAIATANGLDPKAPVKPGQVLAVPTLIATSPTPTTINSRPESGAAKQSGAAKPAPAPAQAPAPTASPSPSPATPSQSSNAPDPKAKRPPEALAPRFIWPIRGDVRRNFMPRKGTSNYHDGIDIAAHKGDAVRAVAEGKVIFAGQGPSEYGQTVIIYHTGRWTTTYAFLDRVTVQEGDRVRKGERVGLAGQTGIAKQPQLHFEVRRNRIALDPLDYLPDFFQPDMAAGHADSIAQAK